MHSNASSPYYEHIVVSGPPYERGTQYGQKACSKIRANIAHYLQPGQLPPWDQVVEYIQDIYMPALESYFPAGLAEMKGIAKGAGVTLEEIIMLNARYDLSRAPGGSRHRPSGESISAPARTKRSGDPLPQKCPSDSEDYDADANECTSAAFLSSTTSNKNVIACQNWDISSYLYTQDIALLLEVHPDPSENIPSMMLLTEAGQLGRSGMNSAGLGLCANALNSSANYFPTGKDAKPCLPIAILRRLFLHSSSFPQGLQAVYNAPRHVSGNLTLATAEGFALCMELTPHEAFILNTKDDFIVHGNHFLHPAFQARPFSDIHDTYPGGSSWYRHLRFTAGVEKYLKSGVDVEVLKSAFSDHLGYPQALCQHVDKTPGTGLPGYPFKASMTIACVMYDLTRRVVTLCKGTPCTGLFREYRLDD